MRFNPSDVRGAAGACCAAFPLPSVPEQAVLDMVIALTTEQAAARMAPFGVVVTTNEPLFTCRLWDERTGGCRDYANRPDFCRDRRRRADGLCAAGEPSLPPCRTLPREALSV